MTEDTSNQLVSNENKYEVLKTAHGSKSATPPKINFKLFKAVSKFRYSYVMGKGNNDKAVRRVLEARGNWMETERYNSLAN